jgi:uncharacterized SAM-binding protein YcdF (DUF218 family)
MPAISRVRRAVRIAVAAALLLAAIAAGWFVYDAGRYLQHEDPLQRADAIFVLAGTRAERALEAVDLYREGYAPWIVLSPGRLEPAEVWLWRKGVRFPSEGALIRDAMAQLGVPSSAVIVGETSVDNTAQEATLLRRLAHDRGWRRVIVVTSKYHTRRAGFAFRRAMKGSGLELEFRASRYDTSDPAHWWRYRKDYRFVAEEWEKLILYRLGLSD